MNRSTETKNNCHSLSLSLSLSFSRCLALLYRNRRVSCFPCYCRNVFAPIRTFGKRDLFFPSLLFNAFVHLFQERTERAGKLCLDAGRNLICTRARVPLFPLRLPFASCEIRSILRFLSKAKFCCRSSACSVFLSLFFFSFVSFWKLQPLRKFPHSWPNSVMEVQCFNFEICRSPILIGREMPRIPGAAINKPTTMTAAHLESTLRAIAWSGKNMTSN